MSGIPNSRVLPELEVLQESDWDAAFDSVDHVKGELEKLGSIYENPEAFWSLGDSLHYDVSLTWSQSYGPGYFDVRFKKLESKHRLQIGVTKPAVSSGKRRGFVVSDFGNNPLHGKMTRTLTPELIALTEGRLPHYMVPSNFVFLSELPLTPSGKIDRKVLPLPQRTREVSHIVLPSTDLETIIAQVWMEVLQIESVSVRDTFFELGGHSLTAIQVVNRLKETLGIQLRLISFFSYPTIEQLAAKLDSDGVSV